MQLTEEQRELIRYAAVCLDECEYKHTARQLVDLLAAHNAGAATEPSTLSEQIKRAKAEVATWTPERRDAVRLQGSDPYTQMTEAQPSQAAREVLRKALRDAFNSGGRSVQERIPLTAGVYAETRVDKLYAEIERIDREGGGA